MAVPLEVVAEILQIAPLPSGPVQALLGAMERFRILEIVQDEPHILARMETIRLSGYILEEKLQIARRFLVPRQTREHGLAPSQLTVTSRALRAIIDGYAREPGVRGLENAVKKICRKTARSIVEKKTERVRVDVADVPGFLGKRVFTDDNLQKQRVPGVVMGLAWTSMGGETLYIEAAVVTMATAIYSLVTGRVVKPRLAMTGELSLKGRVLPIGGVKEKAIAAKRAKVKHVILPEDNRKDFEELPAHVRRGLQPHYASTLKDVLRESVGGAGADQAGNSSM